jgi:hypothetical protein
MNRAIVHNFKQKCIYLLIGLNPGITDTPSRGLLVAVATSCYGPLGKAFLLFYCPHLPRASLKLGVVRRKHFLQIL